MATGRRELTDAIITGLKFLHISALSLWCAGLVALPLLLARHHPDRTQHHFTRLRLVTHHGYTRVVTPAAVIAIAGGTALIYLRGTWTPWFLAKLVLVGLLALFHAWVGHITLNMGERDGEYHPPPAWPLVGGSLATMIAILVLVLAKPAFGIDLLPGWLTSPRNQPLPVGEVPM